MSLLDNLVSYWSLDEASGTRVDSHGSNNLTDNNTVGSTTGVVSNAASFVAANSEYLSHASNTDLQTGDIDFTLAAWAKLNTKGAYETVVSKDQYDTSREYLVYYDFPADRFALLVSSGGSSASQTTLLAQSFGSVPTGTWCFIVICHDSINNALKICVNDGTVDSAAWTTGVYSGSAPFQIGASDDFGTPGSNPLNGEVDEVGFWKRVLTAGEITWLYNSGSGRSYSNIVASAGTNFFTFFP